MSKNSGQKKNSSIFSFLTRFSEFIYSKIPESLTSRLLISKKKDGDNGLFSKLLSKFNFKKRVSLPVKRYIAKSFDNSFLLSHIRAVIAKIPDLQLKCVGLFYFTLGLSSTIVQLVTTNALVGGDPDTPLYMSVGACVIGGIFCGSSKSCYTAFSESRILSGIFFNFFNIQRKNAYLNNTPIGRPSYFIISGILMGVIASITSVPFVLLFIPALLVIYAVLAFPESGAVALCISIPFLSYDKLAVFCALVTVAWFLKLIRGKRIFKFTSLDLTVLAFAAAIFFAGIISVSPNDSIRVTYTLIPMLGAYFAVSNLLRTPEWIRKCGTALVASFSVSLIAGTLGEAVRLIPSAKTEIFGEIFSDTALSIMSINPVFIHLAVALLPLTVIRAFNSHSASKKVWSVIAVSLTVVCLFIGRSRSGTLAAIIGLTILLMLVSKKSLAYIIPAAVILPLVISLMPSSVTGAFNRLFSFDGAIASYRQEISYTTNKIMGDSLLGGIGLSEGAFSKIYPLYTNDLSQKITHATDLYSQITVSLGISGLIIFVLFIIQLLRKYFSYITSSGNDDESLKNSTVAMFSGLTALLIMGLIDYIWLSPSVFLLFWLMSALFMASVRTAESDRYSVTTDEPTLEIDCNTLNHFSKLKDNVQ